MSIFVAALVKLRYPPSGLEAFGMQPYSTYLFVGGASFSKYKQRYGDRRLLKADRPTNHSAVSTDPRRIQNPNLYGGRPRVSLNRDVGRASDPAMRSPLLFCNPSSEAMKPLIVIE